MKAKWTCFLFLLVFLCAGKALAAQRIDSGFSVYIGAGESLTPDYPDLAHLIGEGLTKEDFNISYYSFSSVTFSSDGQITVPESTKWPSTIPFNIVYSPKVSGVGIETHFTANIYVRALLTEITAPAGVTMGMDETAQFRISQTPGSVYDLRLGDYDKDIVDVSMEMLASNNAVRIVTVTPRKMGETVLSVIAYNGMTVEIPIRVTAPATKLEFAKKTFFCYVGETVDLRADLGGGSIFTWPEIVIMLDSIKQDLNTHFPDDWQHFYAAQSGFFEITMKSFQGFESKIHVVVCEQVNCAEIRLSVNVPHIGKSYGISTFDENGHTVYCPLEVTKGADIAYIEKYSLVATGTGPVELTAYNADGSKTVLSTEITEVPTKVILNATEVTLDIGETFDLEVGFDRGATYYYITTSGYSSNDDVVPSPVRMEGQRFIAQAPGQCRVSVLTPYTPGVEDAECIITVRDSDKAIRLVCPEEPLGVHRSFQLKVVDKTGKEYPAVFSKKIPTDSTIDLTEDGLLTGKSPGKTWIRVQLTDGRLIQKSIQVERIPEWIRHPVLVCKDNDTEVPLQQIESDIGLIPSSEVTVSVADPSIVSYSNTYYGGAFTPHKTGTTVVTLKAKYGGAQTSFTFTVVKYDSTLYQGAAYIDLPAGYYTTLPAVLDENGKERQMTWEITHQGYSGENSDEAPFLLEGDTITCLAPGSFCEVKGTASTRHWVRVNIRGYRITESISFKKNQFRLHVGDSVYTDLSPIDEGSETGYLSWGVSNYDVIQFTPVQKMYEHPSVTALSPGASVITVELPNGLWDACLIMVYGETPLTLPSSLKEIGANAFTGTVYTDVYCPEGLKSIGEGAFMDCKQLQLIYLPESITHIADQAFDGCRQLTICCPVDSYAHEYAKANGIPFVCY